MDNFGVTEQLRQKNIGKTGLCFFPESAIVNTVFHEPRKEKQSMLGNVYTIVMAMPQMMMGRVNCI